MKIEKIEEFFSARGPNSQIAHSEWEIDRIGRKEKLIKDLIAVAKAAKKSLENAALVCDQDIDLDQAIADLERE